MNTNKIDILNVALIILSLAVAFIIPFELFLFSYAVLGPLHYLTEINWLNDKNYFVRERKWMAVFFLLAIAVALVPMLQLPSVKGGVGPLPWLSNIGTLNLLSHRLILIAFIFAAGLVYFKGKSAIALFLIAAIASSSLLLKYVPGYFILAALFIPTIIHVYFFTLLFMVFGTINKKTGAGIAAIVLLALCPFIIVFAPFENASHIISDQVRAIFLSSGFQALNRSIADIFSVAEKDKLSISSASSIKIQVFISFAYTYHYLNWFSKTSIIGWNKNLKGIKPVVLAVLWVASICLYMYDYKTGLSALLFLSLLHVFVEFPLNIVSIKAIVSKLFSGSR